MSNFYSKEFQEKNIQAHSNDSKWGASSEYMFVIRKRLYYLQDIVTLLKPKSILDYGCGKGLALSSLKSYTPEIRLVKYEPFIDEFNSLPTETFDLVICYNVLQIVEAEYFDRVIDHIYSLSSKYILLAMNYDHQINNRSCDSLNRSPEWYFSKLSRLKIKYLRRDLDHNGIAYSIDGQPSRCSVCYFLIKK